MSRTSEREPSIFGRTLSNLSSAWRDVTTSVGWPASAEDEGDVRTLRRLMRECLESRGGESSGRKRVAELGRRYLRLDNTDKTRFLKLLAMEFACDESAIAAAVQRYRTSSELSERLEAETQLRHVLVPPRVKLLTQFNALPDGTKFLVDMRADLLPLTGDDPYLRHLEEDLRELLTSWFDIGFINLREITWHSSAALLEKLIAYEAVHEIRDWADLRNRLDSDRRCYALFHPRMVEEPLAFVEVALTDRMAESIQALLDESAPADDPQDARAAIFYSISNTQQGLRGISFGDYLIKQVVGQLNQELPKLDVFATLSPIPNFRQWLERTPTDKLTSLTTDAEYDAILKLVGEGDLSDALRSLLARERWSEDEAVSDALRGPMLRFCARYLLERRDNGQPIDPVARFHLKNGARVERINWLGDTSAKGLRQSAGMMVNYRYAVDHIEQNHEAYMRENRIVLGSEVKSLLRGWKASDGTPLRKLA